jgi:hypothetical protein
MNFSSAAYGHVYLVTNKINGKQYVGQTTGHPERRWWRGHVHAASALGSIQMPIVLAIRKYGAEVFVLEILSCAHSQQELDYQECTAVLNFNTFAPNGYNLRAGRGSGCMSSELRQRLSDDFPEALKEKFRKQYTGQRWSDLAYQRGAEATQVTYKLRNPDGELVTITNIRKFAANNGTLQGSLLNCVARGQRWRHAGWFIAPEENWPTAISLGESVFRCPQCLTEWESLSPRHANIHVVSCCRRIAMLRASYQLGNINENDLLEGIEKLQQPHEMICTRLRKEKQTYTVISPEGAQFEVSNMRRFCFVHGLSPTKMSSVINGRLTQHKGWTTAKEATT